MTLTKRIHCLADAELAGFHAKDAMDKSAAFALNLNFEVAADAPFDNSMRDEAKTAYKQFLDGVRTAKFFLFEVQPPPLKGQHGTNDWRITQINGAGGTILPTQHAPDSNPLVAWLEAGEAYKSNNAADPAAAARAYWLVDRTSQTAAGSLALVNESAIGATHELRASHTWNAPVGHSFALTHIARGLPVPPDWSAKPTKYYYILPFFGGMAPVVANVNINAVDVDTCDFVYDIGRSMGVIECRASRLKPPPVGPIGLVTTDGYFVADPESDQVRRLLNAFEEEAATLLSPAVGLASARDDAVFKPVWRQVPPPGGQPNAYTWVANAPNAAWLAVSALCVALDPMVIGLMRPGSGSATRPEGQILSVLVSAIIKRIGESGANANPAKQIDDLVANGVRAYLGKSFLFCFNTGFIPNPDSKLFAAALRYVHNLSDTDQKSPVEDVLLDVLIDLFADPPWNDAKRPKREQFAAVAVPKDTPTGFGADILSAAIACQTRLHDEAAFETAILRFFETASAAYEPGNAIKPDDVAACMAGEIGAAVGLPAAAIASAVKRGWQDFRTAIVGSFNGAEAARRSAGADFLTALLASNYGAPAPGAAGKTLALHNAIVRSSAYAGSLFKTPVPGAFDAIFAALPRPPAPPTVTSDPKFLAALATAQQGALSTLSNFVAATPRFVPDSTPHPLAIQIADSLSVDDVDVFAQHFDGVAIALRRIDSATSPFAHLNLARLTWTRTPDNKSFSATPDIPAALHPILPAVTDQRSPLFVNYDGFPFASRAFSQTIPYGDGASVGGRDPFYAYDAADFKAKPNYQPAPLLAYGRTFESVSFITSNSGAMPKLVRASADVPWMPLAAVDPATVQGFVRSTDYQRRTAIGRIAIVEIGTNGAADRRIGAPLTNVHPLAGDYPRLVVATHQKDCPGTLDLMRLSDGSGVLQFPEAVVGLSVETTVELADPDWFGAGTLTIELFGPPQSLLVNSCCAVIAPGITTATLGTKSIYIDLITTSQLGKPLVYSLRLRIGDQKYPSDNSGVLAVPITSDDVWWLRLTLTSDDDAPASLSFAEPDAQKGASHGLQDAPLLLLAPVQVGVWKKGLNTASAMIVAPRIGFLDFERWFANRNLSATTFEDAKFGKFLDALLEAYIFRHADRDLADGVNNLPDPAVAALRVTLTIADRLGEITTPATIVRDIEFAGKLKSIATNIDGGFIDAPWSIADLKRIFVRSDDGDRPDFINIDQQFAFRLDITAADALALDVAGDGKITAKVPPGVVAHLTVAPLVEQTHFEPVIADTTTFPQVFHKGMEQYVARASRSRVAFPATMIRIEAMVKTSVTEYLQQADYHPNGAEVSLDVIAFAGRMIDIASMGSARRYDLVTNDRVDTIPAPDKQRALRSAWRILGEIDTTTQRWRAMGRPIYGFPNPRAYRADGNAIADPVDAALRLQDDGTDVLSRFERDAFFDRQDVDAQTVTQKLAPLPARTTLQSISWEVPSASYFRHRFMLRSRYAGALANTAMATVVAWPMFDESKGLSESIADRAKTAGWTLRVAMFADLSRLIITRPQLRAILPLTSSPSGSDADISAAPVLAIIQEPPFVRGGLAERLGAELAVGFGYGFERKSDDINVEAVHILDARKEIGPDPRLSYRALDANKAMGLTLRVEGPAGLTFDQPNAPAPAFSNSLATLTPVALTSDRPAALEEHFMGVSLRRYLDPRWAIGTWQAGVLEPEYCWWIELSADPCVLDFGKLTNWLTIIAGDGFLEIQVAKIAIDPTPVEDKLKRQVPLARFSPHLVQQLVLLHQPVATNRYSTSILAIPVGVAAGSGVASDALPVTLATFEWSPRWIDDAKSPPEVEAILDGKLAPPDGVSWTAWRCMTSAPTLLSWTRSGRDHDLWQQFSPDFGVLEDKVDIADLEANFDSTTGLLTPNIGDPATNLWLASSTFAEPNMPVHVHRRLAVVTTRFARGGGRPMEIYHGARLLDGAAATFPPINIQAPQRCRLVEFETPAMILTDKDSQAVPLTYRSAYFDLTATGYQYADPDSGAANSLEFYFRFVGSPGHLKTLTALAITLEQPQTARDRATPDILAPLLFSDKISFMPVRAGAVPLALRLRFFKDLASAWWLGSDGKLTQVSKVASLARWDFGDGVMLKLSGQLKDGGEFWADVSLLHSKPQFATDQDRFDFDWLFTGAENMEPASAARPDALRKMTEAQARIIAVSPPMPVTIPPA
jgi:hypothetical protein